MKNYITLFSLIIGPAFFLSCDKESNPMFPKGLSANEKINLYFPGDPLLYEDTVVFSSNSNSDRNVLIEDYTGVRCNNCPPAAIIAKGIETANTNRAFVLSVHAGGGANTFQYPIDGFDYTTEAGTEYSNLISGGIAGNPSGLISRTIPPSTSSLWVSSSSWGAQTTEVLTANDLMANIQIQAEYYPETKGVFVHYEVEALQDLDPNTKILIFLAEHKVISAQKLEDSSTDPDYEHHNVLSGVLSSNNSGDVINSSGLLIGEKKQGLVINGLDELNSNREIVSDGENDIVIFALVVNSDTFEVLQVVTQDVEINKQL